MSFIRKKGLIKPPLSAHQKKLAIIRIAFFALVIAFLIESLSRYSILNALMFLAQRPMVFIYNVLIIFMTLCISLFFKKKYFYFGIISFMWIILGVSNYIILFFRKTPLTSDDFQFLANFARIVGIYFNTFQILLLILAIVVSLLIIVVSWFRTSSMKRYFRQSLATFLIVGTLLYSLPFYSESIYAFKYTNGNIVDTYDAFGFAYSFVATILNKGIEKPTDYDQKTIEDILKTLNINHKDSIEANIIFVQLESFFDVHRLANVQYSKNPIPNFSAIKQQFSSGLLQVPTIGGGTANTEFEVLTGMNLDFFGIGEYPYKSVLINQTTESLAFHLRNIGYQTTVIHNNSANFYRRHLVFANLGFDYFSTIETMNNVEYNEVGWAKDAILVNEIMATLVQSKEKDFIYTIAVQSHGDYPRDASISQRPIQVMGNFELGSDVQWEYYLGQIYEVDQMIGHLLEEIENHKEPTIIVFFGDHMPGLDFQDFTVGDVNMTEYVIWNNLDLKVTNRDLSSYQLGSYVLKQLNIQEGLLTQVHQNLANSLNYQSILHKLQYDLVYGFKYAYHQEDRYQPTSLTIGKKPIQIISVSNVEDGILVFGEQFTPFSQIMINGSLVETIYSNEFVLKTTDSKAISQAEIAVAIVSDNNEIVAQTEVLTIP